MVYTPLNKLCRFCLKKQGGNNLTSDYFKARRCVCVRVGGGGGGAKKVPFKKTCYRYEYSRCIRAFLKVCRYITQRGNNNKTGSNFQAEQTKILEECGLNTTGREQWNFHFARAFT